jgi:hypothetical protein
MLRAFVRFHLGLWASPLWVKLWLAALMAVNMAIPLAFLDTVEARVVLGVFVASFGLLVGLTALAGFTRILGLGHVLWIPLIVWLLGRIEEAPPDSAFGLWLRAVIALNAVSLVIDASDVVRYARGERQETVSGLPA